MRKRYLEKRVHRRKALNTEVVFEDEFGDGLFYVESSDVSMGGLFLDSDIPLKTGTMMFLSFTIPGHKRPVRVTGQVVRRGVADVDGSSGMGIRFVGLSEMARKRLEEFLEDQS